MWSIENLLRKLVAIQSDTGTALERDMARAIHAAIKEDPYFQKHPELCGAYVGSDRLERPVVWALRKGSSRKTVILMGHYDAVEIESYGRLKPCALNPDKLREELKKRRFSSKQMREDLEDGRWLFGRGAADMKAGLAINLHTLFTCRQADVNILFTAVPDEENLSSGALQSLDLYEELQRRYDLDYRLALVSEPQIGGAEAGKSYQLIGGSMGKILPVVLVKGVLTHAGTNIYNGFNPSLIFAEILSRVELCTDFVSADRGVFTQPPSAQMFRDLKPTYDVSIPRYAAGFFNMLFLWGKAPAAIMEELKKICLQSAEKAVARYEESFRHMVKKGFLKEEEMKHFQPRVMTFNELMAEASAQEGFGDLRQALPAKIDRKIKEDGLNLPAAGIEYMKAVLDFSSIDEPVVVIGIAPPYYPAVTNGELPENILKALEAAGDYVKKEKG